MACNRELKSLTDRCGCFRKKAKWKEFSGNGKKLINQWNKFIEGNRRF